MAWQHTPATGLWTRDKSQSRSLAGIFIYPASMTPAIQTLKRAHVSFELLSYHHDPANNHAFGMEAATQLGQDPREIFKTLIASSERGELMVGMVPVSAQLDLKALAHAYGCRHCEMASPATAERATGYVVGGISPLGQKKKLPMFIDTSAQALPWVRVSAGRRGLQVSLSPQDLARLVEARFVAIARDS